MVTTTLLKPCCRAP